uniref:terminase large subunit domain-containing protein n=1 Tax=uncultured Bilophila sp. TaxID=529385 RepID=UPI00345C36C8
MPPGSRPGTGSPRTIHRPGAGPPPPQLPDILNIWGCPDTFYRKVITLEDVIAGGCDLFDLESLKLEYSGDEFRNLFLCEFVDDTQSVFRLADLETC